MIEVAGATGAPGPGSHPAWTLDSLLAPMSVEEFVRDYWTVRSLYVPGVPSKFAGLFDLDRFRAAVAPRPDIPADPLFRLNGIIPARAGEPLTRMTSMPTAADRVDAMLAAGTTICVNKISAYDARLDAVARAAVRALGWTGTAFFNAYLSPGDSGADVHWDSQVTTALQISGSKRWRFAPRPALAWPGRPAQLDDDGSVVYFGVEPDAAGLAAERVDVSAFEEVVLEPGDLLCLPAGTWHSAKGVGHSLALNLAFGRARVPDFVAAMVAVVLGAQPEWRSGLPPVPTAAAGSSAGNDGPSPAAVAYLSERLAEAAKALESADPGGRAMGAAWRRLLGEP